MAESTSAPAGLLTLHGRHALALVTVILWAGGTAHAQTITQLTDARTGVSAPASLAANGLTGVFTSASDPLGTNADHSFELYKLNVATNASTQLTSDRTGGALLATIDDAASMIAFMSQADLTGGNHDQSPEIFVMHADGTGFLQLTSSAFGSSGGPAISGTGTKVVFTSTADLPCASCANADHSQEVFVIDANGAGLRQLSASTRGSGSPRISNDGTRVVFTSSADLTPAAPGNADLSTEIYAIGSDGTGLRQLTATIGATCTAPALSGNGLKIAFQSNADLTPAAPGNADLGDEIFIIGYDGTGLRQLTNSKILTLDGFAQAPAIDDAATVVVFHSLQATLFPVQNLDANVEIWKISPTGTGLTALTSSLLADTLGSFFPSIAGDSSRVAFLSLANPTGGNADLSPEIFTVKLDKTGLGQNTTSSWAFTGAPSITPDGSRIAFASSANLLGTDAGTNAELYVEQANGTGLAKLTSSTNGDVGGTSITANGSRIAFQSAGNYGGNSDNNDEIFVVNAEGTGLAQLTSTSGSLTAPVSNQNPRISGNGSRIAFQSNANLTAGNADATTEIFAINPEGTGLQQLTSAIAGASTGPRIDAAGTLVAFGSTANLLGTNPEGNSEIFVIGANGVGLAQLTSTATGGSAAPDISTDGLWVVFSSTADLVAGGNTDLNRELFVIGTGGSGLRQLTHTSGGANTSPVFSGDGLRITFSSTAPLFQANPDGLADVYQLGFNGGGLTRLTASHASVGALGLAGFPFGPPGGFATSQDGSRVALAAIGNYNWQNPDFLPELWLIDLNAPWQLSVNGSSATRVSWLARAGAWSYDVIRGTTALITELASTVDVGPVQCIEDDSPDLDTLGFEDAADPAPGTAFFYLVRSFDGTTDSDYGLSTSGKPRVPSSSDCAP